MRGTALIGALVLAKVVLVLEHVTLGAWIRTKPALLDVILRTALRVEGDAARSAHKEIVNDATEALA